MNLLIIIGWLTIGRNVKVQMRTKKRWFIITLIIVFAVGFILQPAPNFVKADSGPTSGSFTQCYLNVRINLSGAGHLSVGSGYYNYGATVVVTEYTNTGFVFDGWYLDGNYQGKLSSYVVEMNREHELVAVFSKRPVSLTITVNPQGAGTTVPASGISTYNYGDSVIVTEYPSAGYVFDGWYLDGSYIGSGNRATINMDKDHQLSAYFTANPSSTAAPTPTPTPTPTATPTPTSVPTPTPSAAPSLPSPDIAFSCKSSSEYSGFNVQINGLLTVNGVGLSGAGILLSYSVTAGNSWNDLAYVSTNDNGGFNAVWMPSATGNYLINATWAGDEAYSRASNIVNFAVTPIAEAGSVFSVTSNSTLSSFSFNSATKELSFSVAGQSGTLGFVSVSIPKSLMSDASNIIVLLDGEQITYYTESRTDSWTLSFAYQHSTHNVVINLNSEINQTPTSSSPTIQPTAQPTQTDQTPTSPSLTPSPTIQPSTQPVQSTFENVITYVAIAAFAVIIVLIVVLVFVMKKRKTKL